MSNHLKGQISPYLLQHADNPTNWYPWGNEAFEKAKAEDKPIFLSIGYSTCHWCHVMAHESFEDEETAEILNKHFVCIKVDKEERPDIDSIYMSVCQAFTGSGGWPTSIFMTAEQKPFFAGTYFPLERRFNMISFKELLLMIHEKWDTGREELLQAADEVVESLRQDSKMARRDAESLRKDSNTAERNESFNDRILQTAVTSYWQNFDDIFGGFGDAPKFPTPHNLIFLLTQCEKGKEKSDMYSKCLEMAEKTLIQMYRGGIFDHIGQGFSRYSTDRYFLVPHFEKMLYDNALLMIAYCKAYEITQKAVYQEIAEKTASYIMREMTASEGGFYCAQDADSEGEEGKYYLFEWWEVMQILGREDGETFCRHYDITQSGNFEEKNIPNLLKSDITNQEFEQCLSKLYSYRRQRYHLHLDDKILTSWNALMIAAMCRLSRISGKQEYLNTAKKAEKFIEKHLSEGDTLYAGYRKGKTGVKGFLDDYANYIYALMNLYAVTYEEAYIRKAQTLCHKVIVDFWDEEHGGFYLYGDENETLIMRPKETYDGAIPSGNSMMAYNLVHINLFLTDAKLLTMRNRQLQFMYECAKRYPTGYAMFLTAYSDALEPPVYYVCKDDCCKTLAKL